LLGAYNLIKQLSKGRNNFLIILTGDSEIIAKNILKKAGISKYFHFLATGEHITNRIKLMKKTVKKAYRKAGVKKFDKIIVIGDSIHDIEAGKAVGALTISVLTGNHTKKQLKKAKADYIFRNLNNKKILKIIEKS
jgi:phosphoglycolate phosphatase